MLPFHPDTVTTPCYIVDRELLENNLRILRDVAQAAECKILLAQKAFSMFHFYPLISRYLHGTAASGLYEARLGREQMPGREVHVYAPAFRERDFDSILAVSDHIIFNSFTQWEQFGPRAIAAGKRCGMRINPECSTQEHAIYDPCAPGSRLGVTPRDFCGDIPQGLTGLHFHTLCEQDADALETTFHAVERHFGHLLDQIDWLNMGGGHHITSENYDRERLIRLLRGVRERHGVDVYLEPGEAVALNAGFLVTQVLDLVANGEVTNAILDTSAACHMPDVLEMPYRPPVVGGGLPGERAHTYRLAGPSCLAGDIVGDYSFDTPLIPGSRIVFADMAIYTMVKNNTFNGVPLPDICASDAGAVEPVRVFDYSDFRGRLS